MSFARKPEREPFQALSVAAVVECIASFMSDNDVACSLRQLNKFTADLLSDRRTVHLSQPCPPCAFEQRWGSQAAMRMLTCSQRQKLLHLTAVSGVLPNLRLALSRTGCVPTAATLAAAAAAGQLAACKTLRLYGCAWNASVPDAAARAGQRDVVMWLLDTGCPYDSTALLTAAAGAGHGELCELLLQEHGFQWSGEAAQAAARSGFTALVETAVTALGRAMEDPRVCGKVLQGVAEGCDFETLLWFHSKWVDRPGAPPPPLQQEHQQDQAVGLRAWEREAAMTAAISSRTPDWRDKVEWLRARGYPVSRAVGVIVAALPDAPVRLVWMREQKLPLPPDHKLASAMARGRRLDLLELLEQSTDPKRWLDTIAGFAVDADLAFLQELHARGALIRGAKSIEHAARAGDLEAVAWLLECFGVKPTEGGPAAGGSAGSQTAARLTASVFTAGAASGRMEMLKWLHERDCPWTAAVFVAAAGAGAAEQIEWLAARGCPVGDDGEPYVRAARNGDLATLKLLHRMGCGWGPDGGTFTAAVAWACELPVLEELLEAGCPVDWDTAMEAAQLRQRPLGVVGWLQEQRQRRQRQNARCVVQ